MKKYNEVDLFIKDNFEYIRDLRRYFHMYPELSKYEYKTADKIEEVLREFGLKTKRVKETGVYTEIKGDKPGKTIILRADIDALPMEEEHICSYTSKNKGVMHSCGHDVHTACLLSACKYFSLNKDKFNGTIKVCFQQAEEVGYGAKQFINEGLVKADRSFGIHVASNIEVGKLALVKGSNNASVDFIRIKVIGKEAHVQTPHLGVDALYVSANIVTSLQALVTRLTSPLDNVIVSIGKLEAGTAYNIVAKEAILEGTIRVLDENIRKMLKTKIEELVLSIARSYNAEAIVEFEDYTSVLVNEDNSTEFGINLAQDIFGKEKVITNRTPALSGDDFAEFINEVEGCYCYIGSKNDKIIETTVAHHNSHFDVDEECLSVGVMMYIAYSLEYLNS